MLSLVRRIWIFLVCAFLGVPLVSVIYQAVATLDVLTQVERERDEWQRPSDVLALLSLREGDTVVDLGCGAGYFALKLSPMVGTTGGVLATDIRRESLAFLWIRATIGRHGNLRVIHGQPDDPRLPPVAADAVLISNTYHELAEPKRLLEILFRALRSGGRLVVLDRGPRAAAADARQHAVGHRLEPAIVERDIRGAGFAVASREDRFIDRPADDDIWWVIAARKP
jgi:ubiquinone/menaquinone biosynthesis C-methylase UbiE